MDYMPADLHHLLDKSRELKISQNTVIHITYKLLCALNFMHSAGLMHRDLKPSNVLIDDTLNLRICDFGLSRSVLNERDLRN
jgi:serine/threonine protein kinase